MMRQGGLPRPLLCAAVILAAAPCWAVDRAELERAMELLESRQAISPVRPVREFGRMLWSTLYEQEWRSCEAEPPAGAEARWSKLPPEGGRWLTARLPGRFYLCAGGHWIDLGEEPASLALEEDGKELKILVEGRYYARIRARDLGRRDLGLDRELLPEAWLFMPLDRPSGALSVTLEPKSALSGYGLSLALKSLQDQKISILSPDSPFRQPALRRAALEWINETLSYDEGPVVATIPPDGSRLLLGRTSGGILLASIDADTLQNRSQAHR